MDRMTAPRLLVVLVLFLAACGDSGTEAEPATVTTVTVAAPGTELTVGETMQMTATVLDADGNVLTGHDVSWSASPETVASVSASGLVTALAPGSATIRAACEGRSGTQSITVRVAVDRVEVDAPRSQLTLEQTMQLEAAVYDADGDALADVPITWSSSAPAVASVTATGLVEALTVGTATIRATTDDGHWGSVDVRVCDNLDGGLGLDETVTGTLATDDCLIQNRYADGWQLELEEETYVQLNLRSPQYAAMVRLVDFATEQVWTSEPSGDGYSLIARTLAAGSYFVWASSDAELQTGDYTLSTNTCTPRSELTLGQPATGALEVGDCVLDNGRFMDQWSVELSEDGTVALAMSSSSVDALVGLANVAGEFVLSDDDSGDGTDALATGEVEAGSYTVWATSFGAAETGAYTLLIGGDVRRQSVAIDHAAWPRPALARAGVREAQSLPDSVTIR